MLSTAQEAAWNAQLLTFYPLINWMASCASRIDIIVSPPDCQCVAQIDESNILDSPRQPGLTAYSGSGVHVRPFLVKRPLRVTIRPAILTKCCFVLSIPAGKSLV